MRQYWRARNLAYDALQRGSLKGYVDVPAASGHGRAVVIAGNLSVTTLTAKP